MKMSQGFGRRDLNPRVTATVSTPYKSEPIRPTVKLETFYVEADGYYFIKQYIYIVIAVVVVARLSKRIA